MDPALVALARKKGLSNWRRFWRLGKPGTRAEMRARGGTNAKCSVCALIESALRAGVYETGCTHPPICRLSGGKSHQRRAGDRDAVRMGGKPRGERRFHSEFAHYQPRHLNWNGGRLPGFRGARRGRPGDRNRHRRPAGPHQCDRAEESVIAKSDGHMISWRHDREIALEAGHKPTAGGALPAKDAAARR
jgi:hypothetical protein